MASVLCGVETPHHPRVDMGSTELQKQTQQPVVVCHGHSRPITRVAFSRNTADGCFVVSACKDGAPMLRDGATGDWIGTFEGHHGAVWDTCFSHLATHAFTASADFTAKAFDAFTGDCVASFDHTHVVKTVHSSSDSTLLASGGFAKSLLLHNLDRASGDSERDNNDALVGHMEFSSSIRSARFVGSSSLVAVALNGSKSLALVDSRTMTVVAKPQLPFEPFSLDVSMDSSFFICAGEHGASVFDSNKPDAPTRTFDFNHEVTAAAVLSGASRIATGGQDMWVHILDYKSTDELCALRCACFLLFLSCSSSSFFLVDGMHLSRNSASE